MEVCSFYEESGDFAREYCTEFQIELDFHIFAVVSFIKALYVFGAKYFRILVSFAGFTRVSVPECLFDSLYDFVRIIGFIFKSSSVANFPNGVSRYCIEKDE